MTTEIDITQESTELAERSMQLVVVDAESFEASSEINVAIEKMKKEMKEYHAPLKKATHEAHKAATAREKADLAPLEKAGMHIRGIRAAYVAKEDDKQRKAQAKKDEAAEKAAEKEREKLRAKAEKEKDPEKKQEIEEQVEEVYAKPMIVKSKIAKSDGISWVKDIEVEVTNPLEVLEGIISGRIPQTVYELKPTKLKAWAKANGIKGTAVDGIRVKDVKRESVRSG